MWSILKRLIFHTGKDSELWWKTIGDDVFLLCFRVKANVPAQENEREKRLGRRSNKKKTKTKKQNQKKKKQF